MAYEKMTVAKDAAPHLDDLPTRKRDTFPEIDDQLFWDLYEASKAYSVVHVPGFYNVYTAMRYLSRSGIRGSAVECGCFLGGIAIFMGLLRAELRMPEFEIVLFDTFKGAPAGSSDVILGTPFVEPCELPSYLEVVPDHIRRVVGSLGGYRFVPGLVEDTAQRTPTGPVALLRLDTDYYSSTKAELESLYPRLVRGGVLIIDDYGMFAGSRRATDEYFETRPSSICLQRIDLSVWSGVKLDASVNR